MASKDMIPWLADDETAVIQRSREAALLRHNQTLERARILKPVMQIAMLAGVKVWDLPTPPVLKSFIADFDMAGEDTSKKFSLIITAEQKAHMAEGETYYLGFTPHHALEHKTHTAQTFLIAAMARPSAIYGELSFMEKIAPSAKLLEFKAPEQHI